MSYPYWAWHIHIEHVISILSMSYPYWACHINILRVISILSMPYPYWACHIHIHEHVISILSMSYPYWACHIHIEHVISCHIHIEYVISDYQIHFSKYTKCSCFCARHVMIVLDFLLVFLFFFIYKRFLKHTKYFTLENGENN